MNRDPCDATPGCRGRIDDEGYCARCGRPRRTPPRSPAPTVSRAREEHARSASGVSLTDVVVVPAQPVRDPRAALMENPVVPEERRFCRAGHPAGRRRNGGPAPAASYCPVCGVECFFVPRLKKKALVARRYRVHGCLGYGGCGWVYLATDEQVEDLWVVLKGLLNLDDVAAAEAAVAERRSLARLKHRNIVKIYDCVLEGDEAYTVMEYVEGQSLRELLAERQRANDGRPDPLPVSQGIAYILGILPAFGYLHERGLLYNDCKPANVVCERDDVKLIDLGAVTHIDEPPRSVFGTVGFQAPEVSRQGPSVTSDLFAVGRCLAALVIDFKGHQTALRHTLPGPDQQPILRRHESLYRFLCKATAGDPAGRFQSAGEMRDQLEGVLRQVVAVDEGSPRPATSRVFSGDRLTLRRAPIGAADWRHLPRLLDAAALSDPTEHVASLRPALDQGRVAESVDAELSLAGAYLELGRTGEAEALLERARRRRPRGWRADWYTGLVLLGRGKATEAQRAFDRVSLDLPGELAPLLAGALASELAGDLDTARRRYEVVSAADLSFGSACFGLARVLAAQGDRAGAAAALERVPDTSSLAPEAQIEIARMILKSGEGTAAELRVAAAAIERLEELGVDHRRRLPLLTDLLARALRGVESDLVAVGSELGRFRLAANREWPVNLDEISLRDGLERAYRDRARLETGPEKVRLVDEANRWRNETPT